MSGKGGQHGLAVEDEFIIAKPAKFKHEEKFRPELIEKEVNELPPDPTHQPSAKNLSEKKLAALQKARMSKKRKAMEKIAAISIQEEEEPKQEALTVKKMKTDVRNQIARANSEITYADLLKQEGNIVVDTSNNLEIARILLSGFKIPKMFRIKKNDIQMRPPSLFEEASHPLRYKGKLIESIQSEMPSIEGSRLVVDKDLGSEIGMIESTLSKKATQAYAQEKMIHYRNGPTSDLSLRQSLAPGLGKVNHVNLARMGRESMRILKPLRS